MSDSLEVYLIRHASVEDKWRGVCYGAMDVSLSREGEAASLELAAQVAAVIQPKTLVHSGLKRTRFLIQAIANAMPGAVDVREDHQIQERNYGDWQGLTWDNAYQSDPEHFHHLIEDPEGYFPPAGESTAQMQQRAVAWLEGLTVQQSPVVAAAHSGTIAALAGALLGLHARDWSPWMVKHLKIVQLRRNRDGVWSVQPFQITPPMKSPPARSDAR